MMIIMITIILLLVNNNDDNYRLLDGTKIEKVKLVEIVGSKGYIGYAAVGRWVNMTEIRRLKIVFLPSHRNQDLFLPPNLPLHPHY